MLRFFLSICLLPLLLGACSFDEGFEAYCRAQLNPVDIEVLTEIPTHRVDQSLNRAQISDLLTQGGQLVTDNRALAATRASLEHGVFARHDTLGLRGLACARPSVHVKLRLVDPVVYMASEYPVGTCRYDTVYLHEMRHVQAYEALLRKTAATVREQLDARFPPGYLGRGGSPQELQKDLDEYVEQTLMPGVSRLLSQSHRLQTAIDSEEEYLRLTLACGHHDS